MLSDKFLDAAFEMNRLRNGRGYNPQPLAEAAQELCDTFALTNEFSMVVPEWELFQQVVAVWRPNKIYETIEVMRADTLKLIENLQAFKCDSASPEEVSRMITLLTSLHGCTLSHNRYMRRRRVA